VSREVTHLLFDLGGVLIDTARLHPCYSESVGQAMAARYGGSVERWRCACDQLLHDWDSYYADLNLESDEGMDDLWEGLFRTARGLFRLAEAPEPSHEALTVLARELPALAVRPCPALYPDVIEVLQRLSAAGFTLGVASHAIKAQARALLAAGGIDGLCGGWIVAPDTVERFQKDARFYTAGAALAEVSPALCLVVDDDPMAAAGARAAGMSTLCLARSTQSPAGDVVAGDLWTVAGWLGLD
jgi:HAD superfamily hydrolase (TIGR01509 family)